MLLGAAAPAALGCVVFVAAVLSTGAAEFAACAWIAGAVLPMAAAAGGRASGWLSEIPKSQSGSRLVPAAGVQTLGTCTGVRDHFFAVSRKVGSNRPMLVGYVRSTREGALPTAEDASLRDAGCEVIFADCAGSAAEQQPELGKALESLRPQDVLMVTGLDRLAGGLRELISRMVQVQAKGASVRTLQGSIESGPIKGKELLEALLSFDQQIAGARKLQSASAAHEHAGRPRLLDDAAVRLAACRAHAGESVPQIARSIGVSARKLRQALHAESASTKREKLRS